MNSLLRVRLLKNDVLASTAFLDLPGKIATPGSSGERRLGSCTS